MNNNINSTGLKLSDVRQKRSNPVWTADNVSVKPEPGDIYFDDKAGRDAGLIKDFKQAEKLKAFYDKSVKDGQKPRIYDAEGNPVMRGSEPEYTDKSVSVMKSAMGETSDKLTDFLESFGEELSETPKKEIETSMKVQPGEVKIQGKKAVIGSFNIEWLGTKHRKEEDFQKIAEVIKDTGAQVLGIQEVSDERGLKKVMKYLPDHGYILGKSGKQKVGVIFDKKRVKYNVNSIDQIDEVVVSEGLRAPLVVDMKVDNGFDFTFVVAHLKARFDDKSLKKRKKQAQVLNNWLGNHMKECGDKDVIVVGDFNDFVGSDALNTMGKDNMLHFAAEEAPDGMYSNIRYKSIIDHGGISSVEGGAMEEYIPGSLDTVDEKDYPGYTKSVSDHKPIFFEVRSDIDNDE